MSREFFLDPALQRKLEIAQAIQQLNAAANAIKNCPIHAGNIDKMIKKAKTDVRDSEKLLRDAETAERLMQSASVSAMAMLVRKIPDALEQDNVAQAEYLYKSSKARLTAFEKLDTTEFKRLLGMKDLMANCLSFMARFLQALYNVFSDLNVNQLIGVVLFVLPEGVQNTNTLTVDGLMHWIDYANKNASDVEASLKFIEQQFNFQDSQLINTCMPLRVEFINTHLKKMIEQSIELFTCFVDKKQLPKGVKGCTSRNIDSWKGAVDMQKYEAFLRDVTAGKTDVTISELIASAERFSDRMPSLESEPRPAPSM